ncbi:MAG: integrase core domain-containing protein, partial [Candidatus Dormibacteria bacterium]
HGGEYLSEWAALGSISGKLGISREALRRWVRRAQVDGGLRSGVTTLEREWVRELVHHPDRGVQYLVVRYTERLAEAGLVGSVGSKGDSYENTLAESFNGLYKTQLIRKDGPWRGLEDVEHATLDYVHWFNRRRLHTEQGTAPPAEFEAAHYHEETPALLASSH